MYLGEKGSRLPAALRSVCGAARAAGRICWGLGGGGGRDGYLGPAVCGAFAALVDKC